MPRQKELEERVGVLEAQIKRLLERRPDIEGGREYILKESISGLSASPSAKTEHFHLCGWK